MKDIEITIKAIEQSVNKLTDYSPNEIFYGESISPKQKKEEELCHKAMAIFYDSSNHQPIYEALAALKSSILLGCNDIVIKHVMAECGTLERLFNKHLSIASQKSKSEPRLHSYYTSIDKLSLFGFATSFCQQFVENDLQLNEFKLYYKQDYKTL
ncbi:hypothetical protein VmeM32_00186 [Vibrio phage vB_VmeM-32]|nr:hypothetical protein VmeM32_00186 [Vibrio phage vB_VmeM-32]